MLICGYIITLLNHKDTIEKHLYDKTKDIFQYDETITLYDLTNTYFEGGANNIEKAARGRSKDGVPLEGRKEVMQR